jgi:hypothetical protein
MNQDNLCCDAKQGCCQKYPNQLNGVTGLGNKNFSHSRFIDWLS